MARARTRRRRSGSVIETRPGRFQARVTIINAAGKRTGVSKTFGDPKLAAQWVSEMEVKKAEGEQLGQKWSTQPLIEYMREFYTVIRLGPKGREISKRTCQEDLAVIELYLGKRNPKLAATPLSKVTTSQLALHFRALSDAGRENGEPLAMATVSRLFRILRARLFFAVRQGRIKSSPAIADLIPVSGTAKREQRVLSAQQARAFLDVCEGERYGALFAAMLWTGCRPSELAGLQWRDADLDRGVLSIRRALVRLRPDAKHRGAGTSWILAPTKTKKDRQIPIPEALVQLLRRHRAAQAAYRLSAGSEYEDHGLVFTGDFGKPVHLDLIAARHFKSMLPKVAAFMLGRELPTLPPPSRSAAYAAAVKLRDAAERSAMAAAEFPALSLYSLRHSMATLLLESGVHAKIVADRLGHSTTATTLQVYSHVTPHIQQQAVTALEESIGSRSQRAGGAA